MHVIVPENKVNFIGRRIEWSKILKFSGKYKSKMYQNGIINVRDVSFRQKGGIR